LGEKNKSLGQEKVCFGKNDTFEPKLNQFLKIIFKYHFDLI
jgi:hypothetical protein